MPTPFAAASASHAAHSSSRPSAQRSTGGICGQRAGPPCSTSAPPTSHASVAIHHAGRGGVAPQPSHNAAAQAAASASPSAIDAPPAPLSRAHSQPAAAISSIDNTANGQATGANSAGNKKHISTSAVTTRCLSMVRSR